jgi:hypothetical protein
LAVEEVGRARSLYPKAERKLLDEVDWERIQRTKRPNHYRSTITAAFNQNRLDPEFFAPLKREIDRALTRSGSIRFRELEKSYLKGVQPSAYTADGNITVIKSKDVVRGGINIATCDRCAADDVEIDQGVVEEGMSAINMTGVGTLGRAAVIPESDDTAVLSVDVSGWSLDESTLPIEYVCLFLNSRVGMEQTLRYQTGSSGQLHIYPEHVRNLLVYVKRDANGRIDRSWHVELASQVRDSSRARISGMSRLRANQLKFANAVGLNPRIMRE